MPTPKEFRQNADNAKIMYGSYQRTRSIFENSDMMAVGRPGADEIALLEPFRDKVSDEVFGEAQAARAWQAVPQGGEFVELPMLEAPRTGDDAKDARLSRKFLVS